VLQETPEISHYSLLKMIISIKPPVAILLHVILACILLLNGANTFRCYSCIDSKECSDPFNPEKVSSFRFCPFHSCVKFKGNVLGSTTVIRACSLKSVDTESCTENAVFQSLKGKVCYCKTENCNAASTIRSSLQFTGSLLIALIITAKLVL